MLCHKCPTKDYKSITWRALLSHHDSVYSGLYENTSITPFSFARTRGVECSASCWHSPRRMGRLHRYSAAARPIQLLRVHHRVRRTRLPNHDHAASTADDVPQRVVQWRKPPRVHHGIRDHPKWVRGSHPRVRGASGLRGPSARVRISWVRLQPVPPGPRLESSAPPSPPSRPTANNGVHPAKLRHRWGHSLQRWQPQHPSERPLRQTARPPWPPSGGPVTMQA